MKASEAAELSNQIKEDLINRYREENKEILDYIYSWIRGKCKTGGSYLDVVYFFLGEKMPNIKNEQKLIRLINGVNYIDHIIEVLVDDEYRIVKSPLDRIIRIEW